MALKDIDTLKSYFTLTKVPTPSNYVDLIDTIFAQGAGGQGGAHNHDDRYVQLNIANVISAVHTFNPSVYVAPFILGAKAQGQTVIGLKADQLNKSVTAGDGLTGGGTLTNDISLSLTTPGNLTVDSQNNSVGSHTHRITSSSAPTNASILASDSNGYLQLVRLGINTTPSYPLHISNATEQARFQYNSTNYLSLTVDAEGSAKLRSISSGTAGNLDLNPQGNILTDPDGRSILPFENYDINIGSIDKKYLTLWAAELWVETLVAQDVIATIGGHVMVAPTTTLTRDLPLANTTIYVKHNQMANGDRVYLNAYMKIEWMAITSAPTLQAEGDYSYTVTRNLDGTGANDWFAGDAILNTGTTGDGYIDIYSVSSIRSGTQYGPSIVGNVRTGTTYSNLIECWAIGNLNGIYGYATDTYGVAFGNYHPTAASSYVTVDATNGFRIMSRTGGSNIQKAKWDINGDVLIGEVEESKSNFLISSGAAQFRTNTTVHINLEADGDVKIGENVATAGSGVFFAIFTTAQTYNGEAVLAGDALIGNNSASKANIFWDKADGTLSFRGGTTPQVIINTSGQLSAGGGHTIIDNLGMYFKATTTQWDTGTIIRWYNGSDSKEVAKIGAHATLSSEPTFSIVVNGPNDYPTQNSHASLGAWSTHSAIITCTGKNTLDSTIEMDAQVIDLLYAFTGEHYLTADTNGVNIGKGLVVGDITKTPVADTIMAVGTAPCLQLWNGTTQVGEILCSDAVWLRFNQNVAKNLYTPRFFRADGGLGAGTVTPTAGDIYAQGDARFGGGLTVGDLALTPTAGIISAKYSKAIAGGTDEWAASVGLQPIYTGSGTLARHNYIHIINPTLTGVTLTNACVFRFDAVAGTHKAVDAGTTKTTPGGVNAWIKVNIAGTIYYIPSYTSKTA